MDSLLTLAFATAVLGLSPGPAVFATIGKSLSQGVQAAYIFILGILTGDVMFALMAMMGLAAIASHYTIFFLILKLIGGGYLIYLGFTNLKHAKTRKIHDEFSDKGWKLYLSGFLLTSSNPKDLLFFIAFLPAFMDLENTSLVDMVIASIVIAVTFFVTLSVYALLADRMRKIFKHDKALTLINRISGVLLILVGIAVLRG